MAPNDYNQREVIDLVEDLITATEKGDAQWELLCEPEELFGLSTPGGIVTIHSAGHREHPFVLRLFDANERKLYEMATEVAPFYNSPEALLERLFQAARNSVFDVGGTIRQIRGSLGI